MLRRGQADQKSLIALVKDCAILDVKPDGLTCLADSVVAEEITKDSEYKGTRILLSARMNNVRLRIQIDFGVGDVIVPGPRLQKAGCFRSAAVVGADFAGQSRSTAKRLRSASEQKLNAPACVARKTTRGARPACSASCHRGAHRHQRSPGFSPGKPNSGTGVERSLPLDFEYARNPAVMTAHTVWLPTSSRLVSQQPSRKKPVIGFKEQTSSRSPSTFFGSLRLPPPPLPASSLNIGILCIVAPSAQKWA
jgi:hypothetical protein